VSLARSLRAVVPQHVRPGCLSIADSFEDLLANLHEMQGLGYSGFATNFRILQTQSGQIDEARAQWAPLGLDLIGVRATLPNYVELGSERALEDIARLAMEARQFGARTLMLHSAGLAPDGKFSQEALEAKAKFLDQSGKRCLETGVFLNYRTQEAEFQNAAAEVAGLIAHTDVHNVYFDLDLGRASRVYPGAIDFFREHPGRTFSMEAPFADPDFRVHELLTAIRRTKWISWLIENSAKPGEAARGTMKKVFGV
jgi:sugar phosphate isomerase/epimerase